MSRIPYTNKVGETLGSIADPAAAYSLRALNGGDPMVARVRRSSDDAERDFTASDVSGGALVDWVGSGNDGFVATWYDQLGNDNHATQSTAGSQPKIVDGGVYLGELVFDVNAEDYLEMPPVSGRTIYALCSANTADTGTNPRGLMSSNLATSSGASYIFFSPNAGPYNSYAASLDGQANDQASWYLNGDHKGSGGNIGTYGDVLSGQTMLHSFEYSVGYPTNDWRVLGAYFTTGATYKGLDGSIQEVIIYNSDQSSNRTAIETNINNHYDIY